MTCLITDVTSLSQNCCMAMAYSHLCDVFQSNNTVWHLSNGCIGHPFLIPVSTGTYVQLGGLP